MLFRNKGKYPWSKRHVERSWAELEDRCKNCDRLIEWVVTPVESFWTHPELGGIGFCDPQETFDTATRWAEPKELT